MLFSFLIKMYLRSLRRGNSYSYHRNVIMRFLITLLFHYKVKSSGLENVTIEFAIQIYIRMVIIDFLMRWIGQTAAFKVKVKSSDLENVTTEFAIQKYIRMDIIDFLMLWTGQTTAFKVITRSRSSLVTLKMWPLNSPSKNT